MATPKKPKPAEEPGYCKTATLANLFACSGQYIGQLTRDGILKKHDTAAGSRYHIVEATRDYVKYLRDKNKGREDQRNAEGEKEKLDADVRLKTARADIIELEVQELRGNMHRSEDVEAVMTDLVFAIRGMLVALPGRLAVDVSAAENAPEAANIIRAEINKVLGELTRYRYDPDEFARRVRERQKWKGSDEEFFTAQ